MNKNGLKEFKNPIKQEEIDKYLDHGKDFIREDEMNQHLADSRKTDAHQVKDILEKSLSIKTLSPQETTCLLNVNDPDLLSNMRET
ncbi:MAG: [FeFe] hydrogenase H-cluster radical SAM maturase HydG, partial [Candidatus Omnitrophica bacterium]|nr:[FeFe] hydrogenase H-cluster radical SAM maturase HydG [Candidatus Omnitrophota bacterium]